VAWTPSLNGHRGADVAKYDQLPGRLDLEFKGGDQFGTELDFSIALTGYTVVATMFSVVTGQTVATFASSITDAEAGKVNISMTAAETSAVTRGTYGWQLAWTTPGNVSRRTAIGGYVEVL